jgi:branched-chain amino acid transport system permease protein
MSSVTVTTSKRSIPLLPARGRVSWLEILLLVACCVLTASGIAPNLKDVILLSFLFGGLALAWNIAGGYAGLISFGHSAFFGVGAYTSTILLLRAGLTPWIGIWIGALISAVRGCAGRSSSSRRWRLRKSSASAH